MASGGRAAVAGAGVNAERDGVGRARGCGGHGGYGLRRMRGAADGVGRARAAADAGRGQRRHHAPRAAARRKVAKKCDLTTAARCVLGRALAYPQVAFATFPPDNEKRPREGRFRASNVVRSHFLATLRLRSARMPGVRLRRARRRPPESPPTSLTVLPQSHPSRTVLAQWSVPRTACALCVVVSK